MPGLGTLRTEFSFLSLRPRMLRFRQKTVSRPSISGMLDLNPSVSIYYDYLIVFFWGWNIGIINLTFRYANIVQVVLTSRNIHFAWNSSLLPVQESVKEYDFMFCIFLL